MAPEMNHPYDVFISYSHQDRDWVWQQLLPRLESSGLHVCIDTRDFEIGTPSLVNMERAVGQSRHTLLVLTPAWTESEWTNFESLLLQTDDPIGLKGRLLPLMLETCDPPKRLGILTYADFRDPACREVEFDRLLRQIQKSGEPIQPTAEDAPPFHRQFADHASPQFPDPGHTTPKATSKNVLIGGVLGMLVILILIVWGIYALITAQPYRVERVFDGSQQFERERIVMRVDGPTAEAFGGDLRITTEETPRYYPCSSVKVTLFSSLTDAGKQVIDEMEKGDPIPYGSFTVLLSDLRSCLWMCQAVFDVSRPLANK